MSARENKGKAIRCNNNYRILSWHIAGKIVILRGV